MLFPQETAEVWSKRYQIPIKTNYCIKCGDLITANIPYATKGWRGLRSAPHGCPPQYDLKLKVPVNKEDKDFVRSLYNDLIE